MPDGDVRTIRDVIHYQYAKIIARSAFSVSAPHIVPRSIRINNRCQACEKIQYIHNQIWACKKCNSAKGDRGLYSLYKTKHSGQKKFCCLIPLLLKKKYLKTIYNCHSCSGTLDRGDMDGDHDLTVRDIDFIIR